MEQTLIEAKYHTFLFKSNRRLMMLYGFALLLTYPLLLFFSEKLTSLYNLAQIGKTLNVLIAILGSTLAPLLMYRHTTSKKSIDVYDALPLQKESLFRIHFFAGFTIVVLPLIISFLLGYIYITLNPQPELLNSYTYYKAYTLPMEITHLVELIIGLFANYTIATFVKQNCGTSLDSFIYTIVVNVLPLLSYLAFYNYANASLLGFNEPFSTELLLYLTPFPMMFTHFNYEIGFASIPKLCYFIVVSIILYISASYLYVNHKSERAESPFMNNHFFPIVSASITIVSMILLYAALQYSNLSILNVANQFIYPILLGCVFYLVLDVIAHRGFTHIFKALLRFILITSIVLGIILPLNFTKGFGYVTYIPDIEDINSVTLRLPYSLTELMGIDHSILITNKDTIQELVDYHSLIIDEYEKYNHSSLALQYNIEDIESNTYPFTITNNHTEIIQLNYQTAKGTISRQYQIPISWTYPLTQLVTSPSFTVNRIERILPDNDSDKLVGVYLENNLQSDNSTNIIAQGFDTQTFLKYLKEDLNTISPKEFFENEEAPYGVLSFSYEQASNKYIYHKNIEIKQCYKSTILYLTNLGILPTTQAFNPSLVGTIRLIYPSSEDALMNHMLCNNFICFYDTNNSEHFYKEISFDILTQFFPYLQNTAFYEEAGYLINIEGYGSYLLSPKLSKLIEDITKDIPISGSMMSYEFK